MSQTFLDDEVAIPDISELVIEDDTPVDNFKSEKQQRLLTEPLYSSWSSGVPFIAAANVGLFYAIKKDPIVPDVFLSLNVQMPEDWSQKRNRTYLYWEFGKAPEVAIEVVSNRKGNELSSKKDLYAQIGVAYYAVFDPLQRIHEPEQMNGFLLRVYGLTQGKYTELAQPWLENVGLGLMLWEGVFEMLAGTWLRWCDRAGKVIPTGAERAEQVESLLEQEHHLLEQQRHLVEQERQQKERLAERLRAMGINPDEI